MSLKYAAISHPIRVLVADSSQMQSQLLVSALRRRPEFSVVSCHMDIDTILKSIASASVQVALLTVDHADGGWQDMAVIRRIHLTHPEIAKILLVETCNREFIVNAFRSGVRGIFCFTQAPFRALCRCINRVRQGQIWVNTEQMEFLLEAVNQVPSLRVVNTKGDQLLTQREEQVVALVAEGLGNRAVASELRLSEHTVKKYLFRIFDKLGISTRVELVLYAVTNGATRHAEWLAGRSSGH